jgi:hypothetical protein
MINPIWAEFPGDTQPGVTSFGLQTAGDYDCKDLLDELQSLNANLLLFLRTITRIDVRVVLGGSSDHSTSLHRRDVTSPLRGFKNRLLSSEHAEMSYLLLEHRAYELPSEGRRPGMQHSDIVLAFPAAIPPDLCRTQHVFAFLPIHNYGLPVCSLDTCKCIIADFVSLRYRETSCSPPVAKALTPHQNGTNICVTLFLKPSSSLFTNSTSLMA